LLLRLCLWRPAAAASAAAALPGADGRAQWHASGPLAQQQQQQQQQLQQQNAQNVLMLPVLVPLAEGDGLAAAAGAGEQDVNAPLLEPAQYWLPNEDGQPFQVRFDHIDWVLCRT